MADNTNDEAAKLKAEADAKAAKAEAEAKDAEAKAAKLKAEADDRAAAAKPIDSDLRDEVVARARLAGATDTSLGELTEALEKATVADLPKFNEQITKLRRKNRKTFHVVSAGRVMHEGELYEHGDSLLLTEQEAAELGDTIVAPGVAAPPPMNVAARKAGKYRVAEERNVMHGGRMFGPGAILELTQDDARSIGDYIVEA